MANLELKASENVAGRFYVDATCITCDTCTGIAPVCFTLTPTHAFVSQQPKNAQEEKQCHDAALSCPVNAIGDTHDH